MRSLQLSAVVGLPAAKADFVKLEDLAFSEYPEHKGILYRDRPTKVRKIILTFFFGGVEILLCQPASVIRA
jgi:hypothetical protein